MIILSSILSGHAIPASLNNADADLNNSSTPAVVKRLVFNKSHMSRFNPCGHVCRNTLENIEKIWLVNPCQTFVRLSTWKLFLLGMFEDAPRDFLVRWYTWPRRRRYLAPRNVWLRLFSTKYVNFSMFLRPPTNNRAILKGNIYLTAWNNFVS